MLGLIHRFIVSNTMPFFLARSNPIETYRILLNKALLQLDGL